MGVILTGAEKERWEDSLTRFAHVDAYQTVGYHQACQFSEGGQAVLLVAEKEGEIALLPLLIQAVPGEPRWSHATSAYGYPGVLATDVSLGLTEELRAGLRALQAAFGVVSISVRLNPFGASNQIVTSFMETGTVGPSVFLDLTQPGELQWRQSRTRHRRYFLRTDRELQPRLLVDESFQHLSEFIALYRSTMLRNNAAYYYSFPDQYYRTLVSECARLAMLFHAVVDGTIVSSTLMFDSGRIVHGHLGGTRDSWETSGVSRWLLEMVRRHYTAEGRSILNLGSGLGGRRDALLNYKQGFGGGLADIQVSTLVLQHNVYQELTERSPSEQPSSFPAYQLGMLPRTGPTKDSQT